MFNVTTHLVRDYTAVPELDRYDHEYLAGNEYFQPMGADSRREVEEKLNKRDEDEKRTKDSRINQLTGTTRNPMTDGYFKNYIKRRDDTVEEDDDMDRADEFIYKEEDVNLEAFEVPLRLVSIQVQVSD